MSWGERSCTHYADDTYPCQPAFNTCNVDCPHYEPNGKPPDSRSLKEAEETPDE